MGIKLSSDFIVPLDSEVCPEDQKPFIADFIEDCGVENGDETGSSVGITRLRSTSGNDILDIDR